MKSFILAVAICLPFSAYSQDRIIVRDRSGRAIETWTPSASGSRMVFRTPSGQYKSTAYGRPGQFSKGKR